MNPETIPSDEIMRGMLPDRAVRVVATMTRDTTREAARRHRARDGAAIALGRAASAGLLLATLAKDRERVTLQLLGDGPLGALIVDSSSDGSVRVSVKHPGVPFAASVGARAELAEFVGRNGIVSVVRDLGMRETFNGQTPMVSGEIDADVEHYLVSSEQIDSVLACEALIGSDHVVSIAGGVLLQALPNSEAAEFLESVRARMRSGGLAEAMGLGEPPSSAEALARAVLGPLADELQVLDRRPVRFACPCSRERAANSMSLLEDQDLKELIDEGRASVSCDFCRAQYTFTKADIEEIRSNAQRRAAGAS